LAQPLDARERISQRFPVREPVPGRVVVVGVCASGKSSLVRALVDRGYDARACAQEHSYVPDMWQRMSRPQALVCLDAREATIRGRLRSPPSREQMVAQRRRLAHARAHCDLYLPTDSLTPSDVAMQVVAWLQSLKMPLARS